MIHEGHKPFTEKKKIAPIKPFQEKKKPKKPEDDLSPEEREELEEMHKETKKTKILPFKPFQEKKKFKPFQEKIKIPLKRSKSMTNVEDVIPKKRKQTPENIVPWEIVRPQGQFSIKSWHEGQSRPIGKKRTELVSRKQRLENKKANMQGRPAKTLKFNKPHKPYQKKGKKQQKRKK